MSGEPPGPSNEAVLADLLRIRDRATAFCFVILRDFQAAEDAYQEAAMTVVRRLGEYSGVGFEEWFWTIQRNVLGTRIRSSRRNPIHVDPLEAHLLVGEARAPGRFHHPAAAAGERGPTL